MSGVFGGMSLPRLFGRKKAVPSANGAVGVVVVAVTANAAGMFGFSLSAAANIILAAPAILAEDGSYILAEDGSKILAEG